MSQQWSCEIQERRLSLILEENSHTRQVDENNSHRLTERRPHNQLASMLTSLTCIHEYREGR